MATKKTEEIVEIRAINNKQVKIRIVGDTPLIVHAWSEKAKRRCLRPRQRPPRQRQEKESPSYESIELALKDESKRGNILNRIHSELDNFVQRNRHIEELADMLIETGEKLKKGAVL